MRANLFLINKIFWSRPFNVIVGLIVPVVISILATFLFSIGQSVSTDNNIVFVGITSPNQTIPEFSLNSINLLIIGILPSILFSMRTSDIFKRINFGSRSNIVSYVVIIFYFAILAVVLYAASVGILSGLGFGISEMLKNDQSFDKTSNIESIIYLFKHANYGEVVYALFIYITMCITISIFISFYVKTYINVLVISFLLILLSLFLNGGLIPLQLIAQSKGFLWTITYFVPVKWASMPLIEAWTQGAAVNSGSYDWNGILLSSFSDDFPISIVNKLGYTSIFDFKYPFVTGIASFPYLNEDIGDKVPINTWYPTENNLYSLTAALWSFFWLKIQVPDQLQSLIPINMNSIPIYTFASCFTKAFDIFAPIILILLGWGGIMFKARNRKLRRE